MSAIRHGTASRLSWSRSLSARCETNRPWKLRKSRSLPTASRRHADERTAVHGDAVRKAAGVLQGRGRTACPMECPGYTKEAATGIVRTRLRARPVGRDAEDHRRGEERPLRCARARGLCQAARDARDASGGREGPYRLL